MLPQEFQWPHLATPMKNFWGHHWPQEHFTHSERVNMCQTTLLQDPSSRRRGGGGGWLPDFGELVLTSGMEIYSMMPKLKKLFNQLEKECRLESLHAWGDQEWGSAVSLHVDKQRSEACCGISCRHELNANQINATMKKHLLTPQEWDTWSCIGTSLLQAVTSWLWCSQTRGWSLCPLLTRWRPAIGPLHTANTLLLDFPGDWYQDVCSVEKVKSGC